MTRHTKKIILQGPVGRIEVAIDLPQSHAHVTDLSLTHSSGALRGLALIAHPHPLLGGTMENKVTHTLAQSFAQLGYVCVRSNFRGVGQTEGKHDHGQGEQDDLLAVIEAIQSQMKMQSAPVVLAGFSFGTVVLSHVAQRLAHAGQPAQRLVLVGTATSRWHVADVPADTLLIHGEQDEVIPLQSVCDWARPQGLPVIIIPGAQHFFHGQLHLIKQIIFRDRHL